MSKPVKVDYGQILLEPPSPTTISQKYRLKSIVVDGQEIVITWLYDHEIEEALQKKDGVLISLEEAARMYYDALYHPQTGFDPKVQDLNLLRYIHAKGYRVDLMQYLEEI